MTREKFGTLSSLSPAILERAKDSDWRKMYFLERDNSRRLTEDMVSGAITAITRFMEKNDLNEIAEVRVCEVQKIETLNNPGRPYVHSFTAMLR
jgi:hypothetical protein